MTLNSDYASARDHQWLKESKHSPADSAQSQLIQSFFGAEILMSFEASGQVSFSRNILHLEKFHWEASGRLNTFAMWNLGES